MLINYERVTKNLVQFVLDYFKSQKTILTTELDDKYNTFETVNNNLRALDNIINYNVSGDDNIITITYQYIEDLILKNITKTVTTITEDYKITNIIKITGDINLTKNIKTIIREYSDSSNLSLVDTKINYSKG